MSSCVVVELVVHVVRERGVVSVLLIRALPGEVVLAGVVAHCQAARWVWFNWGQGHKVCRVHLMLCTGREDSAGCYLLFVTGLYSLTSCSHFSEPALGLWQSEISKESTSEN